MRSAMMCTYTQSDLSSVGTTVSSAYRYTSRTKSPTELVAILSYVGHWASLRLIKSGTILTIFTISL
jgi:hypothetical protein